MLTHSTLDLLQDLNLHGMAAAFRNLQAQPETQSLEHTEWLALLLEHEAKARRQKRFEARARAARLRHAANIEDVDYRAAASTGRCSSSSPLRGRGRRNGNVIPFLLILRHPLSRTYCQTWPVPGRRGDRAAPGRA